MPKILISVEVMKVRKKIARKTARNVEKFRSKIRESQECLREIIQDIEKKFFKRIKNWKTKNVKKLYNDYSLYVIVEDLLQVIDKTSQKM